MGKFKNLTGQKFGKLTVIERANNKGNKTMWLCRCDCGKNIIAQSYNLTNGHTKSCGCICKETHFKTHGKTGTRLHNEWRAMKIRCYNKGQKNYKHYGGRGIVVCDEWLHNFQAFYEWAMANGYNDTLTLDRINVNGNYEPTNCRWVTQKEQQNNRRNNHLITYCGKTQTISQWANELGINKSTITTRLSRGWSIERTLSTP